MTQRKSNTDQKLTWTKAGMRDTLRIGILLESFVSSAWIATIVADLQSAEFASVEAVLLTQTPFTPTYPTLFQLYEDWDYKRNKSSHDSLQRTDLTATLAGIPCIAVQPLSGTRADDAYTLAEIRALQLDIILHFNRSALPDLSTTTRFGVCSFHFGAQQDDHGGQPVFFKQLFDRSPVAPSAILISSPGAVRIAYQGQAASDPASLYRTRNPVYWKSARAALRVLQKLQQHGVEYIHSLPLTSTVTKRQSILDTFTMIQFVGQEISRWLKARAASRRSSQPPKWCICIRQRTVDRAFDDPAAYTIMSSPLDRFYADPFLFERDGKTYLFFEDFRYPEGRALISCCELDANGNPGIPVEVLRRPYHLSYPFLFEDSGEIYMVPETRGNQTIELYRATKFPTDWAQEANLIDEIAAVDATIHSLHGKLWMFTSVSNGAYSNCDELSIFSADTLKGPWIPHPQNPVVSDVQSARPAGLVFSEAGRLIRPSQDCGRAYGYATVFSEIVTLTETAYEERFISRILPETIPHAISNHTYNRTERFEVVDRTLPAPIANAQAS